MPAVLGAAAWAPLARAGTIAAPEPPFGWPAVLALAAFLLACLLALAERGLEMRRSKALVLAAGVVWLLVALAFSMQGDAHTAARALRDYLAAFAELALFVLVAMVYANALDERGLFGVLRARLFAQSSSLRVLYWLTGALAFAIAPLAGTLPTALVISAMVLAIGGDDRQFVRVGCIQAVVAANAGGVCSPFGDLTTLAAWQRNAVGFGDLAALFLPALAAWLVPAAIMGATVPAHSAAAPQERVALEPGALAIAGLLLLTLALAWAAQEILHLPAVLGMMSGLGLLAVFAWHLRRRELRSTSAGEVDLAATALDLDRVLREEALARRAPLDVFVELRRVDWDALLFCYGAVLCVGGLATLGWAAQGSAALYGDLGPTAASVLLGAACGLIDHLVVMLAVLEMSPAMSTHDWLLAILATGLGGSLLAIGSGAGIAALHRARGIYTFGVHLKWSWAIALGYAAAIAVFWLLNGDRLS
jgi:Na+/H+ antiporter NhaD/arsenite permease-like protein